MPVVTEAPEEEVSIFSNPENMYVFVPLCVTGAVFVSMAGGMLYSHGGLPSLTPIRNALSSVGNLCK